ncbi:hypothetical protein TNCV_1092341 [Trichonephila clavipes]|nr:hypothetical protein TNCV_1092341 [Trichonephila clavipes]
MIWQRLSDCNDLTDCNDLKCCGISFTYRVNNRGELKLPCGRPLLIGRGEESVLSTLTRTERKLEFSGANAEGVYT